ncbi:alternative ribosome rescue aminoacyl-tRNA hydrolase ArfB [Flammeovirga kamogawensis]|uniref:Aminoacyl-tRNA hydrolase n=1 Tax=Flammeovirga kamogawensis TaxID=373891 RepID=A0ABX8H1R8_9BACT|nr:alternative ribosome rescue aminoacyl-tRNA hydrolase ArfB [Flammeovirga kamogawensis]MBB6462233.1 ribosome-associated protein [Flammeovirga kamogawensis]QWG09366.1 aminoacyl-tRNA hydrolase [Flammeovirga kamogawensis]TRX64886.1 aminoacyl-tRNA hydrolase [Flammeovirga kamogawensis]
MNKEVLIKELQFKAIRSSGAGGQHVNKVSSKVVLSFNVEKSEGLNSREKTLLYKNISSRLTNDKELILACDDSRSQVQNKNKVIDRFFDLLKVGLFVPKKRLASKPSKASIKRMKDKKKKRGDLKKLRQKPNY